MQSACCVWLTARGYVLRAVMPAVPFIMTTSLCSSHQVLPAHIPDSAPAALDQATSQNIKACSLTCCWVQQQAAAGTDPCICHLHPCGHHIMLVLDAAIPAYHTRRPDPSPDRTGSLYTWQSSAQLQTPGGPPASAGAASALPCVLPSRQSQENAAPRPLLPPH